MSAFFVQFNYGSVTTSLSYTSNNTAGNMLIVAINGVSGSGSPSISDTAGNAWTLAVNNSPTFPSHITIWYCINCNGGPNTVTATNSTTAIDMSIYEYSSVTASDNIYSSSSSSSDSVAITFTPSIAGELSFTFLYRQNEFETGSPTSYTTRGNGSFSDTADNVSIPAGSQTVTWTGAQCCCGPFSLYMWILTFTTSGTPAVLHPSMTMGVGS